MTVLSADQCAQRANEEFEGIGALYYARFQRLRPGKDDRMRDSMDDDNVRQFSDWIKYQALTDAIFRIIELARKIDRLRAGLETLYPSLVLDLRYADDDDDKDALRSRIETVEEALADTGRA